MIKIINRTINTIKKIHCWTALLYIVKAERAALYSALMFCLLQYCRCDDIALLLLRNNRHGDIWSIHGSAEELLQVSSELFYMTPSSFTNVITSRPSVLPSFGQT